LVDFCVWWICFLFVGFGGCVVSGGFVGFRGFVRFGEFFEIVVVLCLVVLFVFVDLLHRDQRNA